MAGNSGNQQVKIQLTADTQEALRSVKQLEAQVNRLGDLADQGQGRQKGFLSNKQVQMYQKMMKEIQKTYGQHYSKLEQMEREHSTKVQRIQDEVQRRQKSLNNAQGANKWGDVSSPAIVEHYKRKLSEAQSKVDSMKPMEAELNRMRSAVGNMTATTVNANSHAGRINDMTQMNPRTYHMVNGVTRAGLAAVGVMSFGKLMNYVGGGVDALRARDAEGGVITQKMGTVGNDADRAQYRTLEAMGMKLGYNGQATNELAGTLLTGGTTGNPNLMGADVSAAQRFGRAYAVDPNEIGNSFSMMKKLGAMQEGDMKKFASMIGGEVKKNGMGGREEEVIRSVATMADSLGQTLSTVSDQRLGQSVGLADAIGSAIPGLKGDRAANVVTNMDSAIQNGGNNLDILLGKGVDPSLNGVKGAYKLRMMKAQGATPDNIKRILTTLKGLKGADDEDTEDLQKMALSDNLNIPIDTVDKMYSNGVIDKIMNGEITTKEQLESIGQADTDKKVDQYENLNTAQNNSNAAAAAKQQNDAAVAPESWSRNVRDWWHSNVPSWAQTTATYAGAAGLGMGGSALTKHLWKKWMPNIGSKGIPPITPPGGGVGGGVTRTSPILGADGKPIQVIEEVAEDVGKAGSRTRWGANWGKNLWKGGAELFSKPSTWGKIGVGAAEGLGTGLVAEGMNYSMNRVLQGSANQQGIAKEDVLSNGAKNAWKQFSTPDPAMKGMSVGESYKHIIADSFKDIPKNFEVALQTWKSLWKGGGSEESKTTAIATSIADAVKDKPWASLWGSDGAEPRSTKSWANDINLQPNTTLPKQEVTINITGKIEGMNSGNQTQVSDAITKYYNTLYQNNPMFVQKSNPFFFPLAFDTTRK